MICSEFWKQLCIEINIFFFLFLGKKIHLYLLNFKMGAQAIPALGLPWLWYIQPCLQTSCEEFCCALKWSFLNKIFEKCFNWNDKIDVVVMAVLEWDLNPKTHSYDNVCLVWSRECFFLYSSLESRISIRLYLFIFGPRGVRLILEAMLIPDCSVLLGAK